MLRLRSMRPGLLTLTFDDPIDYEGIATNDRLDSVMLGRRGPGELHACRIRHADGGIDAVR